MKRTVVLFTIIMQFICLLGQTSLPGIVPSPNASDLGHYGNIPVSYYTGHPQISIPLYDLNVGDVSLPITLNYDASGVRMNSLPGWTGHNWTLMAGGCITRVIQGINDDRFLTNGDELIFSDWSNYFHTHALLGNLLEYPEDDYGRLKDSLFAVKYDFAPDIYYFNFMGHSGRFFFGQDGEWKVDADENIEVIFDYTDPDNYILPFITTMSGGGRQPKTIKGFVLRDENGTKYYFGGDTDHIEYTGEFFKISAAVNNSAWAANSWYLRKIEDRMGNTLYTLNYTRGYFICHVFYSAWSASYSASDSSFLLPSSGGGFNNNYYFPYGVQLIAPIYLSSIETLSDEKISFSSSFFSSSRTLYPSLYSKYTNLYSTLRSLVYPSSQQYLPFYYLQTDDPSVTPYQYNPTSREKLSDPLASMSLKFLLSVSKAKKSTGAMISRIELHYNSSPRLHLKDICFYNQRMTRVYKYDFQYNNFGLLPPDYLTLAVDHWGYYRGVSSGPTATNVANYYFSRNPVPAYTQYGLLKQITYPTGGVSKFYYEQNDFSKYQSDDRLSMNDTTDIAYAGGVRISRIEDYENAESTTPLVTRTFNYHIPQSSKSSGQLFSKPRYWWPNWRAKTIYDGAYSQLSQFCTSAILPLSNSFGAHVGYSYVTESFSDGKKTTYQYSNIADSQDEYMSPHFSLSCPTPYDKFSERSHMRGKLLSVSQFEGNTLKRKVEYTYRTDTPNDKFVWSCNLGVNNYGTSVSTEFFTGGIYKLYYAKYDVVKEETTTFYGSNGIVDTKIYNKKDTILNVSYGSYHHPVDIRITKSSTLKRGADQLTSTYSYPFNFTTGVYSQLASQHFYLLPIATQEKLNNVTIKKHNLEFQSFNGMLLPKYETESKNGILTDTLVTYIEYTGTGKLKKYQKRGNPVITLQWTNNDCLLSRKTVNGSLTTQYNYTPYNLLSSVTMPNGDILNYTYDYIERLIQISDKFGHVKQKFNYNYINK